MAFTLEDICSKMLYNADMQLRMGEFPSVKLEFVVSGAVEARFWKVVFLFESVIRFQMACDHDARSGDSFMVLETRVSSLTKGQLQPGEADGAMWLPDDEPMWKLDIFGDMPLSLTARHFEWQLIELTHEEYEAGRPG